MARTVRDSKLDSGTARLKLKAGKRYWRGIDKGLALGYRRTSEGFGTWSVRLLQSNGKYALQAIGTADDRQAANNADILSFSQAQKKAIEKAKEAKRHGGLVTDGITVADAADLYMTWYKDNRRAYSATNHSVRVHILPALGDKSLSDLTKAHITAWLDKLASRPARVRTSKLAKKQNYRSAASTDDEKRARRATANRVFNILKAILNRAFDEDLVADNTAWRRVKPFPKVDEARVRFLTDAEGVRLVNACQSDLRQLVNAALLTGARYGELVAMRVNDVNIKDAQVYIAQSKSGKPRYIPLNAEGVALFRKLTIGGKGTDLVFTRKNGAAWGKNHHVRALAEACKVAKITPAISFHELRHTYASHLAKAKVDLLTISKLLGHADTRITSKHYAHLTDKTLAAAVEHLPSFAMDKPVASVPQREARKAR